MVSIWQFSVSYLLMYWLFVPKFKGKDYWCKLYTDPISIIEDLYHVFKSKHGLRNFASLKVIYNQCLCDYFCRTL